MRVKRLLASLLLLGAAESWMAAGPARTDIGRVTRLIPRANFLRGGFGGALKENAAVAENDKIQTQDGARVRVVLDDGSILNIASNSMMTVKAGSQASRAGSLELRYGMVRAIIAEKAGRARFQIRTQTAVAGVLGTTVFVEQSNNMSHIINMSDPQSNSLVQVASSNPRIRGDVTLRPGEGTMVAVGQPPIPPHVMPVNEVQAYIAQTELP